MKAAGGKKGRAVPSGTSPTAKPSGQRPNPANLFNPRSTLDPSQMEVRAPGHASHRRGRTPK